MSAIGEKHARIGEYEGAAVTLLKRVLKANLI